MGSKLGEDAVHALPFSCVSLSLSLTHPLTFTLTLSLSLSYRWVTTFQKVLRMLWEAHVRSSDEQDAAADLRSARESSQGLASAADRAGRSHIVAADVVPPFVEGPQI